MGAVDDGGIGAPVEQQLQAPDGTVLGGEMHCHRGNAAAFAAPVVAEVGVGTVVQEPLGRRDLVVIARPARKWTTGSCC